MAGWSDYADFSSADSLRLVSPLRGIQPVIEAINERRTVRDLTLMPSVGELSVDSLAYIASLIQGTLPQFLTPTLFADDNLDYFNSTKMLAAIGDDHLIQPTLHFSADWLFQQYKILNQMTRSTGKFYPLVISGQDNVSDIGGVAYDGGNHLGVVGYNNWSGCWSIIQPSLNEYEHMYYPNIYYFAGDIGYGNIGEISIWFEHDYWNNQEWSQISYNCLSYNNFRFNRSADEKAATYKMCFLGNKGGETYFYDFGSGLEENKWGIIETRENLLLQEEYGVVNILPGVFDIPANLPLTPPDTVPTPEGEIEYKFNLNKFVAIQEHAVPGGFDFQTGT